MIAVDAQELSGRLPRVRQNFKHEGIVAGKDKKQRRAAKQKEKKRAARKQASVSPIRRIAESKGDPECWASSDFEDLGQIEIFVFKQGGGLSGIACFLVDRGVVGPS